ncbi:MAG: ATP-binding protein, partial [Sphingomicrobium sp.]
VEGLTVSVANAAALALLGNAIEGRDVRLVIRQPELLEHVLAGHPGDLDIAGIGDFGRPWRVTVRALDLGTVFVRLVDRSENLSAEKMRVDFVANASHELRTPLSAVLGYAETLADDPQLPPEIIATFGRTVRDEAGRMLRIVEDLMSLSRIEADRFVAPEEMVDLREVALAVIVNASPLRGAKKCDVTLAAPKSLPKVLGDRAQLMQLLDNLVSNGVRYGCDKPGACVEMMLKASGSRVEASVIDHGPGIPRAHLPRITERFYRVDEARSRESGGTGLGLAIVKHIVERHRGTLAIASKVGVGTTVTVSLPAAG